MKNAKCRSCGSPIAWMKTRTGKHMPVDIKTTKPNDTEYEPKRHISHFATCPQANTWRGRNEPASSN